MSLLSKLLGAGYISKRQLKEQLRLTELENLRMQREIVRLGEDVRCWHQRAMDAEGKGDR